MATPFASAPPPPEWRDIAVDLSRALASPQRPALPLIRAPVRWKEGYT